MMNLGRFNGGFGSMIGIRSREVGDIVIPYGRRLSGRRLARERSNEDIHLDSFHLQYFVVS